MNRIVTLEKNLNSISLVLYQLNEKECLFLHRYQIELFDPIQNNENNSDDYDVYDISIEFIQGNESNQSIIYLSNNKLNVFLIQSKEIHHYLSMVKLFFSSILLLLSL